MINHHIACFRYDIHDTTLKIPGTHQGFSHTIGYYHSARHQNCKSLFMHIKLADQ